MLTHSLTMFASLICCGGVAAASDAVPEPVASEAPLEADRRWLQVLLDDEDWPGLRTEALRLAHLQPRHAPLWGFYTGWARLQLGEPQAAVLQLATLADEGPPALRDVASLAAARAWRGLEPDLALARYEKLEGASPVIAAQARLGAAWVHADGARFDAARPYLPPSASPSLMAVLERPRWRRPGVAALLSAVVPGAGQMYAGAPPEGVAAFFVVGLLATGTVLLARSEGASPGTIAMGAFALSFYGGNLYGAADAAARHNRRVRRQATSEIAALEEPVFP